MANTYRKQESEGTAGCYETPERIKGVVAGSGLDQIAGELYHTKKLGLYEISILNLKNQEKINMKSKINLSPLPQKKGHSVKKILLFFVAPLLSVLVLLFIFLPANAAIYTNTDELADTIESLQPRVIELDNISVKKQPDAITCGITAVTVMSNYYNNTDYEANDLTAKYNSKGTTDVAELLRKELPEKTVVFKSNGINEEMLRDIHASLSNGNPVVVCFGAPNPYNEPNYDSHGSVVYGINLDSETVTIANSYGYKEEISLVDFLNRMSFTERDKYTFGQRFVWKFTGVPKNQHTLVA